MTEAAARISEALAPASLGTMTFGDTVDERTADRIVGVAMDAGVRMIDTANAYSAGECERILSRILPPLPGDVLVASKVGMPHDDAGEDAPLSAAALRRSVEGSLSRLGRERLDVLYLHQPDRRTPLEETLGAVAALQQKGLVGELGVSNYAAWQIADLRANAVQAGCRAPVISQQVYSIVARRLEDEYAEFAASVGLPTVVYNPLAGGLLAAPPRDEAPATGRFSASRLASMYRDRYGSEAMAVAVRELWAIADEAGLSMVELALRWVAGRPATAGVLLGASRPEQLRQSLDALTKGPLPAEVEAACTAVGDGMRGPMPAYNR